MKHLIKTHYDDGKKHLHVLSFGGGTQSIALTLMALEGKINGVIPDYIIFADTGNEPKAVMDQVNKVCEYVKGKYNREIIITSRGNIYDDILRATKTGERVSSLPFHTLDRGKMLEAIGKRQCTNDYKIEVIKQKVRTLLGYKPRQHVKEIVHMWKGISTDEIQRVKPISDKWIEAEHPLVWDANIDRSACVAYVERELGFTPVKSACIICPFHDNEYWLSIKKGNPEEFEAACKLDDAIRNGLKYESELYLHRSRKPLRQVNLNEDQLTFDDFINECEGFCGI